MGEHSELPWTLKVNSDGYNISPANEDGADVAYVDYDVHCAPDLANASYIVRACNAFPELVKALEWIAEIADKEFEGDEKLRSQGARTLARISDRARAALSRAREGG